MAHVPASHALGVYVEPLATDARVVVVGDATEGLGERLVDLGARTVHVYDPDRQRARDVASEPARGVSVRELPAGDFDVRDGAYDLAIVPDLSMAPDPSVLIARLRRLIGPEGAALVCARRDGEGNLGYYELFDLVSMQFASVRMIGQVPFVGVAIAELGDGDGDEAEVSVDTQLIDDAPPPDVFIALAGHRDVRLGAYAVIQLPAAEPDTIEAADTVEAPAQSTDDPRVGILHAQLAEAQLRGDLLQNQLQSETQSLREGLRETESQCVALAAELEATREAAREAGRVAVVAVEQRDVLAARLEHAERQAHQAQALEAELAGVSDAHAREIAGLEEALRDRARLIKGLEQEVVRHDRIARDLVAALEEARAEARDEGSKGPAAQVDEGRPSSVPESESPLESRLEGENADLQAKLDALALDLARRQGDLEATGWRLAELENALAVARAESEKWRDSERKIAALEDELDVVKQALAQEHAARTLAEGASPKATAS